MRMGYHEGKVRKEMGKALTAERLLEALGVRARCLDDLRLAERLFEALGALARRRARRWVRVESLST